MDVAFIPGQFVMLKFEGLNHKFDTRSYSIAGQVDARTIELCIVYKGEGAATPLLFDLQVGDVLLSSLPEGRFILPEEIVNKELFFICTGTGVAPFRCMVKELLNKKGYKYPVHLYFGGRTAADLLYREEFEEMEKQFSNFYYFPVLSRENWNGLSGYVHSHYERKIEHQPDAMFFLCGWTQMIREARDKIKALGYSRQDIKVEFYD